MVDMPNIHESANDDEYDVFISHASEDKDFVDPLAHRLQEAGLRVWYDKFELQVGDSLNQSINYGLAKSRYGVVVLSPSFFTKHWTLQEMNGLVALQVSGRRIILPIWHRITRQEILENAPPLADTMALNTSTQTIDEIVESIVKAVGASAPVRGSSVLTSPPTSGTGPNFAVFYVAEANTSELPQGEKPEQRSLIFTPEPKGWYSVVARDEELEFILDQNTLRVRLDWGSHWEGDEIYAHQKMTRVEPFAVVIRLSDGHQVYLPSVVNTSPSPSWMGSANRSGWMVFKINQ